jgi:hypothetical protein
MIMIDTFRVKPDGTADERRLELLRRIAEMGGKITPQANPGAEHGYEYALPCNPASDLQFLARRDYLEQRFFDRVSLCPSCASHHLNVREICPGCRHARLANEGLMHHFRCGYVSIMSEFAIAADGSRICPKCNGRLHHLGTEYDRLGKAFVCRQCGLITENPPVEAVCLTCGAHTPAEDMVNADVFSYVLTSLGSAAIRRGTLTDREDELLFIADAPIYRPAVILEFLDYEMKRLRHCNTEFSLLLAETSCKTADDEKASLASWLTRLRQCLRDVDLMGQLADGVFLVILPQVKREAAEGLRQSILAEWGPRLPFTLSTIEITEPRSLTQILAHRGAVREAA